MALNDVENGVAWGQTEGGLAVLKVGSQMDKFEKKWLQLIPADKRTELIRELEDLVEAARRAGQLEEKGENAKTFK